jgi:hypothetical protein
MQQHTTKVNPSEETIKIGPLGIRFSLVAKIRRAAYQCSRSACQRGRRWPPRRTRMTPSR